MHSIATTLLITGVLALAQTEADLKAKLDAEMRAVKVDISAAQFGLIGGIVKGAPYSAEAVTESVQVLGDGNRIRRKTTFLVFRDGEGRMVRQEEQGGTARTVSILDPVANVTYTFDYKTQMAFTHPLARAEGSAAEKAADLKKKSAEVVMLKSTGGQRRTETLASRMMEGLTAEGQRDTTTIAAETVGNERPMEVTNERWYSPELQVNLFTHRHDPRSGDVTFQLTRVQRGEPSRSLFEIPPGFTLQSADAAKAAAEKRDTELKAAQKKPE